MKLINTATYALEEFFDKAPPYAILSHTWGDEEVTFADWKDLKAVQAKKGFYKIKKACEQAAKDGYRYAWVDTNCIDKASSSELSEAINSMFAWYRDAQVCYVFMRDVAVGNARPARPARPAQPDKDASTGNEHAQSLLADPDIRKAFKASAWFTRGWTLQELLAPFKVVFYSKEWQQLATKDSERNLISDITGIDIDCLQHPGRVYFASVARRMSWMANRRTKRIEDTAYCMLGLFGIHMALLYGEGHRAFLRLQEEIIRVSNDQTIFCWHAQTGRSASHTIARHLLEDSVLDELAGVDTHRRMELKNWTSILAPHPCVFRGSALYRPRADIAGPYSITNLGLSISLPLLYTARGACAVLDVDCPQPSADRTARVVVHLHCEQHGYYMRMSTQLLTMPVPESLTTARTQIFVDYRNAPSHSATGLLNLRVSARQINMADADEFPALLLLFSKPVILAREPLAAAGMEFVPFYSTVEADNHRLGAQSALVLAGGSTATDLPFHLVIGGRSSLVESSGSDRYAGAGAGILAKRLPWEARRSGLHMNWHVGIVGEPLPRPDWWRQAAFETLMDLLGAQNADLLGAQNAGSWRASPALENVLSWRYSPDGAVVCYFELADLHEPPDAHAAASQIQIMSRFTPSPEGNRAAGHTHFNYLSRVLGQTASP